MKSIAVIGGGIAGVSFATSINSHNIVIFDKGRGIGGRISTRRTDRWHFDHGAQYLDAKNKQDQQLLNEWLKRDWVQIWDGIIGEIEGNIFNHTFKNKNVYVSSPQMNSFVKFQAKGLDYRKKHRIESIERENNNWFLRDEKQKYGPFDIVILSLPPLQALEILGTNSSQIFQELEKVQFDPVWALMLGYDAKIDTEYDASYIEDSQSIRWIARNNSKPERLSGESWVVHTTRAWCKKHLELEKEEIQSLLLSEFQKITGITQVPSYISAHRWRYGLVRSSLEVPYLYDENANIGVVADYCGGNNILSGFLSGKALAEKMNEINSLIK